MGEKHTAPAAELEITETYVVLPIFSDAILGRNKHVCRELHAKNNAVCAQNMQKRVVGEKHMSVPELEVMESG